MPDVRFENLLVISVVAVLAPLLIGFAPRLRIPSVVIEIVAGVVVGPSVLGWVHIDLPVQILAVIGLAFLLFLSGLEIDLHQLGGPILLKSVLGYVTTLALGLAVGFAFSSTGVVSSPLLFAITLSATSLGLIVPVLKDAHQLTGRVGQTAISAATVADFSAIALLSLVFSGSGASPGAKIVLLVGFAVLVLAIAIAVARAGRSMSLGGVLDRLQDTTAQIRVRLTIVLLVGFVALAERFGLESILGAFIAGAVVSLLDRDAGSHPNFRLKLEAIGFGFLVPVFFVSSGVRLDLRALVEQPSAILRVPLILVALLLIRGIPALWFSSALGRRDTLAVALLQATSLPFIVTASQIGVLTGRISAVSATTLVCAGLLSVLIFPSIALGLLRQPQDV